MDDGALDLLPDAVLRINADRRVVTANRAARALLGEDVGRAGDRPCEEVLDPRGRDGKPLWTEGWPRSAGLRGVRSMPEQEVEVRTAGDRAVRVYVTGAYQRDAGGRLTGAVLVLRDAGRRAQVAAAGLDIVSTVSHELRSPLTSVKGYTSLLLNRWGRFDDAQKRTMLEQVHHDADRVTRLITELLDISRLESGRLVLRPQSVDLAELARSVVDKLALQYADLDVTVDFPDAFPRTFADRDKLEQVLANLVENAAKYADPRGIRVVGEATEEELSVAVSDRGEGIPRPDLSRVFTKFFRRAETRPTGSGLGLWISRGLVEAHGGRLTATSNPGQGSTFRFTLPLIRL